MKSIYLFFFLMVLAFVSAAQAPVYKLFTVEDGLPSNQIYELFQDSKGYLWFGTNRGVVRYGGGDFEIFTRDDGLCTNFINNIQEDDSGRILLMSSYCSSWYDNGQLHQIEKGIQTKILRLKEKSKFQRIQLVSIANDSIDWILTRNGHYEFVDNEPQPIPPPNALPFLTFANKQLYFNIDGTSLVVPLDKPKLLGRHYFEHLKLGANRYAFYFKNQLFLYENDSIKLLKVFDSQINSIAKSSTEKNKLIIATYHSGVHRYDMLHFTEMDQVLFKEHDVTAAYEDHEGGLWVATDEFGLFYVANASTVIYSLKKEGIQVVPTYMIAHSDSIYFSTNSDKLYLLHQDSLQLLAAYDEEIRDIAFDRNNDIVVAIANKGVFRVRDNRKLIDNFGYYQVGVYFNHQNECVYLKSHTGLIYKDYNSRGKHMTKHMFKLLELDSSSVYVGANDGVYKFQFSDTSFTQLFPHCISSTYMAFDLDVVEDKVLISSSYGLTIINNDSCIRLKKEDGLSTTYVESTIVDEDGTLWLSTARGFNRVDFPFDAEKRKVQVYTTLQGLGSNRTGHSHIYDNTIWVITSLGISKFNKNDPLKKAKPLLNLNSVAVNNQPFPLQENYELAYDQKVVRVDFMGISYQKKNGIRYEYRLLGADSTWTTTKEHFALFSALSSGSYTFEIRAIGLLPGEASELKRIHFNIAKPLWEQWWFFTAIALAIIGLSLLLFKQRLNRVQQRLENMQQRQRLVDELNAITQQSLSSQLNPHFIFNALNSIQRFVLENDKRNSNKYLARFAQLMRLVLEYSKEPFISLEQELKAITAYLDLETLRLKEKINYNIFLDPKIDQSQLLIPPLLMQPMIENAIWHGLTHKEGIGHIKIEINDSGENYCCAIEDNGIGRKQSTTSNNSVEKEHKSSGMEMTEKRIALASKLYDKKAHFKVIDLTDENGLGIGTRVELILPKEK